MAGIEASRIVGGNPKNGRKSSDFYPTPPEATKALLDFLKLPKNVTIWEPACGENDMVRVMEEAGYTVYGTDIITGQDFLQCDLVPCDWIITNPPFSLAEDFIKRAYYWRRPFAMLLKSQYWHAAKRFELFELYTPDYILPLTWRPDFLWKEHEQKKARLWTLCGVCGMGCGQGRCINH